MTTLLYAYTLLTINIVTKRDLRETRHGNVSATEVMKFHFDRQRIFCFLSLQQCICPSFSTTQVALASFHGN